MADYPTFKRDITTADAHLRDVGNRLKVHKAPSDRWTNILALTLPDGDSVRDELLKLHRLQGEDDTEFYRRAATLFKERYKPTEHEIANYQAKLHTILKGVDESLNEFAKRFNRAWDLAHPTRGVVTGHRLEEKKRTFLHALESDVQRLLAVGGGAVGME
jgi:hypothetical protein